MSNRVINNFYEGKCSGLEELERELERTTERVDNFRSNGTYSGDQGYQESMMEASDLKECISSYHKYYIEGYVFELKNNRIIDSIDEIIENVNNNESRENIIILLNKLKNNI